MEDQPAEKRVLRVRMAQAGLFLSCLPLVGWLFGIEMLVRLAPTHAAIVCTTALSFALLFLGLLLSEGRRLRRAQLHIAWAVIGLAVAETLFPGLHAVPAALGLTAFAPLGTDGMAGVTSAGMVMAALVLWRRTVTRGGLFALGASIFGLSTAVAILLGHSFEPQSIYALPPFAAMSQYTAALFALFFTTLLVPDREPELSPPV